MAASSQVNWSICRPITTRCKSTSHDLGSRQTMPMWNRSMRRSDGNASMCTGSSHSMTPKRGSKRGGGSITRVVLTAHCRIEHQPNLPSGPRSICSANPSTPLETLLRFGSEIAGRPSAQSDFQANGLVFGGRSSSHRHISGFNRSRARQILRFHSFYIHGAGRQVVSSSFLGPLFRFLVKMHVIFSPTYL